MNQTILHIHVISIHLRAVCSFCYLSIIPFFWILNICSSEDIHSFHHPSLKPYPRNWAPDGPTSMSLLARPSPSTIGGMVARRCLFTSRHVTRVGALHFLGGMMMRRPLWRQPRMAPPLASTMKLTRKLMWKRRYFPKLNTFVIDSIKWREHRHQSYLVDCLWLNLVIFI